MAKTNDIDTSLYSDDDWLELSVTARWVYVWAFSNQRCNMAGVYRISLRVASIETGWPEEELVAALHELQEKRFVLYDPDGRWLWVRSRVKHIRGQSRTIAKAIVGALGDLPRGHRFGPAFYREYSDGAWGNKSDRGALADLLGEAVEDRDDWLSDGPAEGDGCPIDAPPMPHPGGTGSPSMGSGAGAGAGAGVGVQSNGNGRSRARTRTTRREVDPDALPADFPQQLIPLVDDVVVPALRRVAEAKGALVVTRAAAARVVASFPRKPHERIAGEFEHYWIHGNGQNQARQDIVATYRNRLDHVPDRAGPIGIVPTSEQNHDNLAWVEQFNRTAPGRTAS